MWCKIRAVVHCHPLKLLVWFLSCEKHNFNIFNEILFSNPDLLKGRRNFEQQGNHACQNKRTPRPLFFAGLESKRSDEAQMRHASAEYQQRKKQVWTYSQLCAILTAALNFWTLNFSENYKLLKVLFWCVLCHWIQSNFIPIILVYNKTQSYLLKIISVLYTVCCVQVNWKAALIKQFCGSEQRRRGSAGPIQSLPKSLQISYQFTVLVHFYVSACIHFEEEDRNKCSAAC